MQLPGGLVRQGQRLRGFEFRALTGALELQLAETSAGALPQQVTALLMLTLARLGDDEPDLEAVRELAVGDRQFLMRRLAEHLEPGPRWIVCECGKCGERFDLCIDCSVLPVKVAGDPFPEAEVELRGVRVSVRCPTGADQEALVHEQGPLEPALLLRLLSLPDAWHASDLTSEEVCEVERIVENMAPEVALGASARCPACHSLNEVPLDPYDGLKLGDRGVLEEVHRLASAYHWSEAQILALTRQRRRQYLELVDRDRGRGGYPVSDQVR